MKILLINSSDTVGGAARAAYRLHDGLRNIGANSQLLVQEKLSSDKMVLAPKKKTYQTIANIRSAIDSLPLKFYPQRHSLFSLQWLPDQVADRVTQIAPDIINLHWINTAFLQIETLTRLKRPLVWTLHDMWAFTGGCHYSGECNLYTASCGTCPLLASAKNKDLSHWVLQRKHKAWRNLNLTIVSPSHWLAKCASSSSIFHNLRVEVIPNGIDIQKYRHIKRSRAREILNLPLDKKLVLFGSLYATDDPRKGFYLLQEALKKLCNSTWQNKLEVVVFGASQPDNPPEFGFKTHYLGKFNDDLSLALVYSSADVFVLPSIQENLANTVMEAIACGTPTIAFNIGGMPDMIEHEKNGYLAQPFKTEDLASGIAWVIDNEERNQKLSYYARVKAEKEFSTEIQANRYYCLFQDIT
jgi:glycosyltransferase involved in cell wall biosynthesis